MAIPKSVAKSGAAFDSSPSLPHGIIYNRRKGATDGTAPDGGQPFRDAPSNEQLDNAGFQTYGYNIKKDTAFQMGSDIGYVESRPFNRLPPGMFIDNQDMADIRNMPMKYVTGMRYPGDGWDGTPSDKLGK